jgi:hypothetical protein
MKHSYDSTTDTYTGLVVSLNRVVSVATFARVERNAVIAETLEDIVKQIDLFMSVHFRIETRLLMVLRLLGQLCRDTIVGIRQEVYPSRAELYEDESIVECANTALEYLESIVD